MLDPMPTDDRADAASVQPLDELLQVLPRLVDRTRSQVGFARALAGMLPCVGPMVARRHDEPGPGVPEHERVDVLTVLADDATPAPTGAGAGTAEVDPTVDRAAAPAPAAPPTEPPPESAPAPAESELPIQDYDSLAASQVVPRLATLGADELRAVQAYEAATRHRQTILHRVAQLLSS